MISRVFSMFSIFLSAEKDGGSRKRSRRSTDDAALRRKRKTADFADTRPGAPGGQFTRFVLIRAYPRHPRFLSDLQLFAARGEFSGWSYGKRGLAGIQNTISCLSLI